MSRRRDQNKWAGTTLAPYLQLESHKDLLNVRQLKGAILKVMAKKNMNALDLSRIIDKDKDLSLSINEIVTYLSGKEIQKEEGMPNAKQLQQLRLPLLMVADKRMDGRISYDEFEEFLSYS
jgi:Ca2+-binding EF-hand superfamily protein